jgi:hypothetical protein
MSRNGRDWHTLIEFCGLVGTIIVDEDGVYDPRHTNGSTIVNSCQNCLEVVVRELRPRAEQGSEKFTGEPRSIRVESGGSAKLLANERSTITDLKACRSRPSR